MQGAAPVRATAAEATETTVRSGPVHITPAPDPDRVREKSYITVTDEVAGACRLELGDPVQAPKFARGESSLANADDAVLRVIAECVKSGPLAGRTLLLIGRADRRGSPQQNRVLGLQRARSLRTRFEALGVDRARIRESSRGELDSDGADEAGWRLDRRVDIVLAE